MATFNKFNTLPYDVLTKKHDFGADTFKVMLTNSAPSAANAAPADISEIAAGGGYSTGGITVSATIGQSSGTAKVTIADTTFTASGSVAAWRYAVLYNSTSSRLIGWWDRGASASLLSGDTIPIDFDDTNGVLQLT